MQAIPPEIAMASIDRNSASKVPGVDNRVGIFVGDRYLVTFVR